MRDNSKFFRQGSSFRYNSRPGSKESNKGYAGTPRSHTKSIERPQGEMFKKVEKIEKEQGEFKKSLDTIMEMLKTINTQYVEEEILINVNYVSKGQERIMLIDSGAPRSIVSAGWFEEYLKDAKVDEKDVKRKDCTKRFRMGKTVYLSKTEVEFPIVMKTEDEDYVKKNVTANVINSEVAERQQKDGRQK